MSRRDRLAHELMDRFAELTGLVGDAPSRRYLWTDAFAVCNYLGLDRGEGDEAHLDLALRLVDQVHHVLGRHRDDDPRAGWISGLGEEEGERHPTVGGLRIGKELPERGADEPLDPRREWDRDGQYFHYLTKWMHALRRISDATGGVVVHRWARELARTAHEAFTVDAADGTPDRMVWKMSIDLTRPLVASMGQHDALDGLLTYLELRETAPADAEEPLLETAIADATTLCRKLELSTGDPLGIGGLLAHAGRLARLVAEDDVPRRALLDRIVTDAVDSLAAYIRGDPLGLPAERRLAFRELGLSIGLHAVDRTREQLAATGLPEPRIRALLEHRPLADRIEEFWTAPEHRRIATWTEHREINMVMLATSLAPRGLFGDRAN